MVEVPQGFNVIQDTLLKRDWIISSFDIEKAELYNPANYLYNKMSDGLTYKLYLDRNIFSFIISVANKKEPKQIYRDAISLIAFCQIAEILIEPNFAVYEKINYYNHNADEAVDELLKFYEIDNTKTDILMKYILHEKNSIDVIPSNRWDSKELKEKLIKYEWLAEWKSLYLIVLNLVDINYQNINRDSKINNFFNWMVKEFRLSLVSIVYAIFLFSSGRMKQMIKFKTNDDRDKKIRQLRNMTWDLYFMNQYFRVWQNKAEKEDFIFASYDSIVKKIIRAAILIQKSNSLITLKEHLHPNEEKYLNDIETLITSTDKRVFDSNMWTPDYRDKLIKEKENILLNSRN